MRQGVTNDSLAKYTRNKLVPEHGLPVDGDQFDLGFGLSNHLGRQRGVVQILGKLLAVVDAPPEEGHDGLRLGGVGLVRIDQDVGIASDRVACRAVAVGDRDAQVVGQVAYGSGGGSLRLAIEGSMNVPALFCTLP